MIGTCLNQVSLGDNSGSPVDCDDGRGPSQVPKPELITSLLPDPVVALLSLGMSNAVVGIATPTVRTQQPTHYSTESPTKCELEKLRHPLVRIAVQRCEHRIRLNQGKCTSHRYPAVGYGPQEIELTALANCSGRARLVLPWTM